MCSSSTPGPRLRRGSHTAATKATAPRTSQGPARRAAVARTTATEANPAPMAAGRVGATCSTAKGMAAAIPAIRSSSATGSALASAISCASGSRALVSSARKSAGCRNATIGPARIFVMGASRLTRPNVHAISGAVTTVATTPVIVSRTSQRHTPRRVTSQRCVLRTASCQAPDRPPRGEAGRDRA